MGSVGTLPTRVAGEIRRPPELGKAKTMNAILPPLMDQYQRRFTYLRLSVTDQCNFRCNYCLPDGYCADTSAQNPFLTTEEIRKLAESFALAGTRKIRITGGEPTLRKDLAEIISICKQTPGIEEVALTTNAYNLPKQLDRYIEAGLDSLNISADSLRPESFHLITGHNKLQQVMDSVDMALERGMAKVKINAVLMKEYNYSEWSTFLNFLKNKPVSLRFIELMRTNDNVDFFNAQHVSGEIIQERLQETGWIPVIREAHAGPAKEFAHPEYAGKVGLIMPYSKDFCNSCNRLRVSSEGNLHLCLFADENTSLRDKLAIDSPLEVAQYIQELVLGKKAAHALHEEASGSTRHLAMLGG